MRNIPGTIFFMLLIGCCLPANKASCQNYKDTIYAVDTAQYDAEDAPPDEDYEDETTESGDEIIPVLKHVSADSIGALKNDKGFYYMAYLDSFLRASQDENKKKPVKEPDNNSTSFWDITLVKYLFWGIAIAVVGFVLFKLFSGEGGMFSTNKTLTETKVTVENEIPENDLDGLLQRAVRNASYRLAVRYQFLKTLHWLGEKGILQLSADKTNYQYATEIQGRPYANTFSRLSLQYEYIWFGEFELNQEQFASVQQQHQQFLKEI